MISFPNREITYVFEDLEGDPNVVSADYSGEFIASYLDGALTTGGKSSVYNGLKRLNRTGEEKVSLEEARNSVGEWIGVFEKAGDQSTYIVAADPFGYQPVFYRQVTLPGGRTALLASNSFRSICSRAKALGATNRIAWDVFFSLIGTAHAWSITMQSHQTLEATTSVLVPGEEIVVSDGAWTIRKSDFFEPGDEDYHALVKRGVMKAVSQLTAASRMPVDQKKIFLSGGRDSRMAIALLAAAGVVNDYTVSSVNPATWTPASARPGLYRDLYVANAIRESFGMNWAPHQPATNIPLSFQDSLEFWQSNRSHKNFRFRAPQSLMVADYISTEIRGAAGETFRGFQAVKTLKSYNRFGASASTLEQDIQLLTEELFGQGVLTGDSLSMAKLAVSKSLEKTGGTNIIDALHRRYSVYRNRSHFGHVKASMATGQIPILPLSQPEFVKAAALLSEDDRYENVMAFDIIELAYPDLNTLEFDSGAYPRTARFKGSSSCRWEVREDGPGLDAYRENEAYGAQLRSDAIRKVRKPASFDQRFAAQNRIKELLLDLTAVSEGDKWLPYALQVKLFQLIEGRRLNPLTLLSKLETAWEVFGEAGNFPAIEVIDSNAFQGRVPVVQVNNAPRMNAAGQPAFRVDLKLAGNSVGFQVVAGGGLRKPVTYNARLLTDSGVIATLSAGLSGAGMFKDLQEGMKYRIQFFAYYEGETMVPFKFFSRYFEISTN